jgi:glycine betaine/proline transport system ATP-binding protein
VVKDTIRIERVDVLFGARRGEALRLLDAGESRSRILEETGVVLGVADATLSVPEGEICVLMGLSGSGKSTLLRTVNRLNPITRGEVTVLTRRGEVKLSSCNAATLRHLRQESVTMVFQQFALLPWRTVRENVGFGLELKGVPKAERLQIVDEKLEMVHLSQWADRYARELSGGMQQRVGLARAFATDADVLLMDEPFSALDPLIRSHLQDELLTLQRELKKTILFVSHDLDEALKLGQQIVIMDEGRIVQSGVPAEIWRNPATDYVRRFVARINPLEALTASVVMTPLAEGTQLDGLPRIESDKSLRDVLKARGDAACVVVVDEGKAVGLIDNETILRQLK